MPDQSKQSIVDFYEEGPVKDELKETARRRTKLLNEIPPKDMRMIEDLPGGLTAGAASVLDLIMKCAKNQGEKITLEIPKESFNNLISVLCAAMRYEHKAEGDKKRYDSLNSIYSKAYNAYKGAKTESKGLREAKKIFGWKFEESVDMAKVLCDYMGLDLHPKVDKISAIDAIRKKYGCQSWDAALKLVKRAIRQYKDDKNKNKGNIPDGLLPNTWEKAK